MNGIEFLLAVLGWCTLINMGMLVVASIAIVCCGGPVRRIHQKWFNLSDEDLQREYFRYLANYKILTLIFNLVPYLAIRLAMH